MAKKKSNLHHNVVPGSGLVAEGYGQRVNSNVEEKDLTPGKDHHNGDWCYRMLVWWVDLQAQPVPPAYLRDSRPCSMPQRALSWNCESLLLCSPLLFFLTASSSAPALQGPLLLITHPSTGALWLGNPCAFVCTRMCFFPSRLCIFLLCNAVRTLLSEDLLHINSIQLAIIFGKRAYEKKIKMRWLICNSYNRKFLAEHLGTDPVMHSKLFLIFCDSSHPYYIHWTLNQALCYQGVIWNRNHQF